MVLTLPKGMGAVTKIQRENHGPISGQENETKSEPTILKTLVSASKL